MNQSTKKRDETMGKSVTISEMENNEDVYRNYLKKIEGELEERSKQYNDDLQKRINDFYKDNDYTKIDFVSGKNSDFMQQSDWSLSNVKAIIDAVSKAVFGDSTPPSGVTIKKSEEIAKTLSEMENMELYIAGKCFEVLSGIVESFGSASCVSYNSSYKDEALGNGFHLFAIVVCDSYKSTNFFENKEIYEYLYIYEVKFSINEAEAETKIGLTRLYEDQIITYEGKVEALLEKLTNDKITPEQYQSSSEIYNTLIAISRKQLEDLKSLGIY